MIILLQNLPPIPSSGPPLRCRTKFPTLVCVVASNNAQKPDKIKPKTRIKIKEPDDYHATLRALNSKGRIPRKALGQHYMLNGEVNEQLVDAAKVGDGDMVLEIGPGTGSLTNVLVESGATILAIEKDPYMAALVRDRFASTQRVKVLLFHVFSLVEINLTTTTKPLITFHSHQQIMKVVQEDFTRCHLRSHLSSYMEGSDPSDLNPYAKVVANIPFNISTDVVKQLLPMGDIFSEVVLLLQEEAALRMVDPSLRTSEYRPINIFINFYSDPEYKFKVPRENFFPQPKVDAAVVVFRLKQTVDYPQVSSTKSFFSMVNSAFNGKRKMLRKSLQHITSSLEIEEALVNIGLPATFVIFFDPPMIVGFFVQSRPEELTLKDFVKLHNLIVDI
ncbi:hypothetical protein OSB04_032235 [Centaurea solstitialis]|uniref:rRNA adenine N(6)-methyltransferase n=1 Tax=Centaurea solstitialis TaxID=347529 RepID=A0AA38SUM4_9ASTR|nr:hypothetical protein OSB04_032235 [Centaurea solstitialis]